MERNHKESQKEKEHPMERTGLAKVVLKAGVVREVEQYGWKHCRMLH